MYGLSLHKPSTLWPPPSEEIAHKILTGIRRKVRQIVRVTVAGNTACGTSELTQDALAGSTHGLGGEDVESTSGDMPIDVGATAPLPSIHERNQTIFLQAKSGEQLKVESQTQLYAQNSLLGHPLISPVLSYLGGLPPLLFIASDKEVLRDEIIYS